MGMEKSKQSDGQWVSVNLYDERFQDHGIERGVEIGGTDFTLDPYAGGSWYYNKPILTLDQIVGQIDSGTTVPGFEDGTITYSFLHAAQGIGWMASGHYPGRYRDADGEFYAIRGSGNTTPFSPEQEAAAREAIQMWDDIIALDFKEVQGNGVGAADIVFQNTSDTSQAFAYYPGSEKGWWDGYLGDVFIRTPSDNWTNQWFTPGGYGNTTLIHEIGHSIGLSHPGAYNYNPNVSQDYEGLAEYAQDTQQYSIMSYWDASESNYFGVPMIDWSTFYYHNPQTPLIHDIYVLQQKYGADPDTRSGDSTYGFNVTDDVTLWVYDFEQNPYPYLAIYDAGGIDTIDASGFISGGQYIDLHAGAFSSIGEGVPTAEQFYDARMAMNEMVGTNNSPVLTAGRIGLIQAYMSYNEQTIEATTGIDGIYAGNMDNVGIAYGTTIENAIGGQQRDAIIGNEVDNFLDGQAGDDDIWGNEGNDTIVGGLGDDLLSGGADADTFVFAGLEMGDLITDFDGGEGDMIDLSGLADDVGGGNALAFVDGFTNEAGQVTYDAGTGQLMMDADGNGSADFMVTLTNHADLDATMLILAA